jgi:phage-related protein
MVENEFGRNGVIYTNSDLALSMAQFNCKIGKMRGIHAFEMFYAVKEFGGLYIQANYGHIHLNKAKVAEVMGENA